MELSGAYDFAVPARVVWDLLNDPDTIASCLPGCDALKPLGDDKFQVDLAITVAAISGRYRGTVAMCDKQPPLSYRLVVEGTGKAGFVNGDAVLEIVDLGETSSVRVKGTGGVGGLIARVGQRLLGSVGKMMMDRFFACLQEKAVATRHDVNSADG